MINTLIIGASTGLLFASCLISFGCILIFNLYKAETPWVTRLFSNGEAAKIIFPFIITLNPTCAIVGIIFCLTVLLFEHSIPGIGLGSPNIAYTLFVLGFSIISWAFLLILSRNNMKTTGLIVVSFIIIFGWIIPILLLK